MKVRVVKIFGCEVLRIESHTEATVSDVVRAMLASRMQASEEREMEVPEEYGDLIPCESCGEMFDPDEVVDLDEEVNARFVDMTEHIIWGKPAPESDDDDDQ